MKKTWRQMKKEAGRAQEYRTNIQNIQAWLSGWNENASLELPEEFIEVAKDVSEQIECYLDSPFADWEDWKRDAELEEIIMNLVFVRLLQNNMAKILRRVDQFISEKTEGN